MGIITRPYNWRKGQSSRERNQLVRQHKHSHSGLLFQRFRIFEFRRPWANRLLFSRPATDPAIILSVSVRYVPHAVSVPIAAHLNLPSTLVPANAESHSLNHHTGAYFSHSRSQVDLARVPTGRAPETDPEGGDGGHRHCLGNGRGGGRFD